MIGLIKFTNLSEMIINSCPKLVESLCGKELFIQRRATGIMNVPGKGQARQWPHYELMSGISPFTYVIWTPLHDLEDKSKKELVIFSRYINAGKDLRSGYRKYPSYIINKICNFLS